jgi:hypothetical protein
MAIGFALPAALTTVAGWILVLTQTAPPLWLPIAAAFVCLFAMLDGLGYIWRCALSRPSKALLFSIHLLAMLTIFGLPMIWIHNFSQANSRHHLTQLQAEAEPLKQRIFTFYEAHQHFPTEDEIGRIEPSLQPQTPHDWDGWGYYTRGNNFRLHKHTGAFRTILVFSFNPIDDEKEGGPGWLLDDYSGEDHGFLPFLPVTAQERELYTRLRHQQPKPR